MNLSFILHELLAKKSLSEDEAELAMDLILKEPDPHQIAVFLTILKYRGETAQEIAGLSKALMKNCKRVACPFPVLDIVGTGGDFANTVNISTGAAMLIAACGVPVAKHGNRSVSSQCGSADLIESLGIHLEMGSEHLVQCIQEIGIGFMYAPVHHPALKQLGPIRRALKFPTVFNILGPLLNPAQAEYALIGASSQDKLELMANALMLLGNKKQVLLFHGNGLDELTTIGPIHAIQISNGKFHRFMIEPQELGFERCSLKDLQGGNADLNHGLLMEAFDGKQSPIADALVLNAAFALQLFGKATSISAGVSLAQSALKSGKVNDLLNKWKAFSDRIQKEVSYEI